MLLNKVWVDCHTKRRTAESTLDFLKLSASDRCFQQPPCKPIFMCQGLNTLHWGWSSPPINRNPYKGYIKPLQLGWWVYQFIPWKQWEVINPPTPPLRSLNSFGQTQGGTNANTSTSTKWHPGWEKEWMGAPREGMIRLLDGSGIR